MLNPLTLKVIEVTFAMNIKRVESQKSTAIFTNNFMTCSG